MLLLAGLNCARKIHFPARLGFIKQSVSAKQGTEWTKLRFDPSDADVEREFQNATSTDHEDRARMRQDIEEKLKTPEVQERIQKARRATR